MRELEGLSRWVLKISRIMRNNVEDNDSIPRTKNLQRTCLEVKWVEENESCYLAFVFAVSLNLSQMLEAH